MKKKGFTLIELLAVIVILAIIALIAIPVIMNIIEKGNKGAFKDSAYGIVEAGELYYTEKLLHAEGKTSSVTFTFPEASGLTLKGIKPTSGDMIITKDGKVALAISNGKYCARKSYEEENITIDENLEDCALQKKQLKNQNPNISSENECIKYDEACESGTKINVQVNGSENYSFYVIKDDGIKLTLIMDRNLGDNTWWYSNGGYGSTNGPRQALYTLKQRTSNWTNIETFSYELVDDNLQYQPITASTFVGDVKARMLTHTEAVSLGCKYLENDSCPSFLSDNLSSSYADGQPYSYWLSTSSSSNAAYRIAYGSTLSNALVDNESNVGLRPVIEISKTI